MNTPTNKKSILILLALVIVIVWSNFFFRIRNSIQPQQDSVNQMIEPYKSNNDKVKNITLSFIGDFRDPFRNINHQIPKIAEPTTKQRRNKQLVRDKTPPLTLRGIVGRTAMLEMKNQLYFLQQGDSLAGGKLIAVYRDSLIVDYKIKKDTLRVLR